VLLNDRLNRSGNRASQHAGALARTTRGNTSCHSARWVPERMSGEGRRPLRFNAKYSLS
jgi:hypothetical protein